MSEYNTNNCHSNTNVDGKMSRVYINPNFKRQDSLPIKNRMFVNPNFSQANNIYPNNVHQSIDFSNSSKIHVNPIFFRNPNANDQNITSSLKSVSTPVIAPNTQSYLESKRVCCSQETTTHVQKSRYCLVRHKENIDKPIEPITKPVPTTVKVSKYKSVSFNVVRNMFAIKHGEAAVNKEVLQTASSDSRYKFTKINSLNSSKNSMKQSEKKQARRNSFLNKSIALTSRSSHKINIKKMKKNNIPCPLYRKYGSCLRKIKGNCEYLHDQKHVSICRKFLKGLCHDTNCLLSHELTDKKMPTCYFYLKGACTKENCPYIHVKLNEKTKICQDFFKGYCERGYKCHFRHTLVAEHLKTNRGPKKNESTCLPQRKVSHVVNIKPHKKSLQLDSKQNNHKNHDNKQQEQRYFRDMLEEKCSSDLCNSIKPNRVKLGTLPSFIHL